MLRTGRDHDGKIGAPEVRQYISLPLHILNHLPHYFIMCLCLCAVWKGGLTVIFPCVPLCEAYSSWEAAR